jgi:uroporphyrinogen decarboxylase
VLERLAVELGRETVPPTLVGFVGAPFTLAAYAIEGRGVKNLVQVKRMMFGGGDGRETLRTTLDALAEVVGEYACFQAAHGAQVVQFFDSWAHHLSPAQYREWALPAARRAMQLFKARHPDVPAVFFANGSAGKLEDIVEALGGAMDVLQLDWSVGMADARRRVGDAIVLQGNVDPTILVAGSEDEIRQAVRECVAEAGGRLVLNVGHGVIKETPESAVGAFCDEARKSLY